MSKFDMTAFANGVLAAQVGLQRLVDHVATESEAMAEYGYNAGMDNPDVAWILTDYDVWVKNPHYQGPPVPHPEDDYWEDD